jgi:hypothetical protein
MIRFEESFKSMSHVTNESTKGIVTPSQYPRLIVRRCRCGVLTNISRCGVCESEMRAGLSIRVFNNRARRM